MNAVVINKDTPNLSTKNRFWHLRDRDFLVIKESFDALEALHQTALTYYQNNALNISTMAAVKDSAYHFDRVAHVIFELNLGFDEGMVMLARDANFNGFADYVTLFNSLKQHVDRLTQMQPIREAIPDDLHTLFKLSGVMAIGALRVIDLMEACHE